MRFISSLRLLFVLIIVAGLSFSIRIGDFYVGLKNAGTAYAQQEVDVDPPVMDGDHGGEEDSGHDDDGPDAEHGAALPEKPFSDEMD